MIEVKNLKISYDREIIKNISFYLKEGQLNILMGRNGAGKSTLIKAICGIKTYEGDIIKNGEISYLNQNINKNLNFSAFETVLIGKINDLKLKLRNEDIEDAKEVMKLLDIYHLKNKKIIHLSGGESQKVFIAQALIKKPSILLLDEPVNELDLKNQYEIMKILKELTIKKKLTTLLILHQLDLIERFADNIILLKDGKIYEIGDKFKIFTKRTFREIFELDADIKKDKDRIYFYIE